MPGEGWSAGIYYLRNLFYALKSLSVEAQPEIILLVDKNSVPASYDELIPFVDEVLIDTTEFKKKSFVAELLNNLGKRVGLRPEQENPLSALLKLQGVNIFFNVGAPQPNFLLPFFTWIPDFQHLHYPQYFSELEIKRRNISFKGSALRGTRVILSSENSLQDFRKFAPWAVEKARVLSFVAQISEDIYSKDPEFICRKYNIPNRFILLPNQFWKHKNHQTVIRALQIALTKEPELTIVCTGNTNEHRDLAYFSRLLGSISVSGVREKMIILGLVPREDLFLLMRQSVAILQPSLFEGWNTTIEEVKSLGKRLILSDIPVHREQDAPYAVYFPPTDEHSLALSLIDIFVKGCPGPDHHLEEIAKKTLPSRTEKYGSTFLSFVQELLEENITSV
jgi:glycosyltransferase involved in cell wall biosynthesis